MLKTTEWGDIVCGTELKQSHLHGGFQDFIPYQQGIENSREFSRKTAKRHLHGVVEFVGILFTKYLFKIRIKYKRTSTPAHEVVCNEWK
jgi:hypothetical protein